MECKRVQLERVNAVHCAFFSILIILSVTNYHPRSFATRINVGEAITNAQNSMHPTGAC